MSFGASSSVRGKRFFSGFDKFWILLAHNVKIFVEFPLSLTIEIPKTTRAVCRHLSCKERIDRIAKPNVVFDVPR
jgi:hypothetical protein